MSRTCSTNTEDMESPHVVHFSDKLNLSTKVALGCITGGLLSVATQPLVHVHRSKLPSYLSRYQKLAILANSEGKLSLFQGFLKRSLFFIPLSGAFIASFHFLKPIKAFKSLLSKWNLQKKIDETVVLKLTTDSQLLTTASGVNEEAEGMNDPKEEEGSAPSLNIGIVLSHEDETGMMNTTAEIIENKNEDKFQEDLVVDNSLDDVN